MLVKCGSEVMFRSGRAHGRTQTLLRYVHVGIARSL